MQFTQGGTFTQPVYQTLLIGVCGGFVYIGQAAPQNSIALAGNQSTAPLNALPIVSMAVVNQTVYFVDGITITSLPTSTGNITAYAATAGSYPTAVALAATWRGRLVLAGDSNNPQNFYMSRAGTPTDWDYSQTDPAAAVAGNLSKSGLIGEPITALIPYTDDYMLIGCAHSLWMLQGDPADGGSIVQVSNNLGVVGKDAWCVDPMGTLYFVATGGLYSVRPIFEAYRPPELLTGQNYNQFFQNLNWSTQIINLVWDAELHYLNIYVAPVDGTAGTHLIFDTRNGGLWPQQFTAVAGPTAATAYLSDASPNSRATLLGGTDGYIRRFDTTATDDDGTALNAYIVLGPFKPFPETGILAATTIDLGELTGSGTWNATVTLASGPDAYSVTEGTPHSSTAINCTLDRRQKTFRQRLRGGWFTCTIANTTDNAYFCFESALLEFEPAGRNRERR